MEATPLQPPFPKLLAEYLIPVAPDRVAQSIIHAAGDENVTVQDLAPLLNSDSGYRHYLFAQSFLSERMTAWTGETESSSGQNELLLSRILGLMGKVSIRNLIACALVSRVLGEEIVREGDEKISTTPSRSIPYALAAEKACEDKNWIFPEAAFWAGLHYDWLAALIKKRSAPPEEKAALDNAFKEGLKIGMMAYGLALKMKDIKLSRYLFATCLLLPIGKSLMASLFPKSDGEKSWANFVGECEKADEKEADFYHYLESRRFPVTHLELSSLIIEFGGLLRGVEKSVYFAFEPERLEKVDQGLHQLSLLLSAVMHFEMAGEKALATPQFEKWMAANKLTTEIVKTALAGK